MEHNEAISCTEGQMDKELMSLIARCMQKGNEKGWKGDGSTGMLLDPTNSEIPGDNTCQCMEPGDKVADVEES